MATTPIANLNGAKPPADMSAAFWADVRQYVLPFVDVTAEPYSATGDGTTDDTAAIQAAIDYLETIGGGKVFFPIGQYKITSTLTVAGRSATINFQGESGFEAIEIGGLRNDTASVLVWGGTAGTSIDDPTPIIQVESGHGHRFESLHFATASTTDQYTIDIDSICGIQFINRSSARFSEVHHCEFARLAIGVHLFDDAGSVSSDVNMDGHHFALCVFRACRESVRIEQSNVYDTLFLRCSFYGQNGGATLKHHIRCEKGHFSAYNCYFGPLKDAASPGGADGVAILVEDGSFNLVDCYSEAHNGPFLDWVDCTTNSRHSVMVGCRLQNTTIPTTYNVRNRTDLSLTILGGYQQKVRQDVSTNGKVFLHGVAEPQVDTDAGSNQAAVEIYGGHLSSSYLGRVGTLTGIASVVGDDPALKLYDVSTSKRSETIFDGDILRTNVPGVRNGPAMTFSTHTIDYNNGGWMDFGRTGHQAGTVTLSTGAATTTVTGIEEMQAAMRVLLTPASAAAATLVSGASSPYISTVTAGAGFTIATADGSNPPAGCIFNWHIR